MVLEELDQRWPRAEVESFRRLSNGQVEVTVTVRDCTKARVSGLTEDVFSVFQGANEEAITRFSGLEDERPIDIVFSVDLSGSMQVERDAVRQAILHFAETFNFRNRAPRFALIGFADSIDPKHRLTRRVSAFKKWMQKLPENAGGMGEDAVSALIQSTRMWNRYQSERVAVVVTDESLQVNSGGRKNLGLPVSASCRRATAAYKCFERCEKRTGNKMLSCFSRCVQRLDKRTKAPYNRCVSTLKKQQKKIRYGRASKAEIQAVCLSQVNFDAVQKSKYA